MSESPKQTNKSIRLDCKKRDPVLSQVWLDKDPFLFKAVGAGQKPYFRSPPL